MGSTKEMIWRILSNALVAHIFFVLKPHFQHSHFKVLAANTNSPDSLKDCFEIKLDHVVLRISREDGPKSYGKPDNLPETSAFVICPNGCAVHSFLVYHEYLLKVSVLLLYFIENPNWKLEPKLYIPSTLNTDYLLWHTQLIICAVIYQIMV